MHDSYTAVYLHKTEYIQIKKKKDTPATVLA